MYGSAPMWSSWPCVNTMPRTCAARSTNQLMSGITRSTPSISCSGNIRPESTTMMSSAHEIAIMLRPISPRPPSATSVSLPPIALLLLKERQLIEVRGFRQDWHGGAAHLYAPRLLLIEVAAHTRHVVTQCSQQARVVEYRSRMVERHVYAVAAPHALPVQPRDAPSSRKQPGERMPTQYENDLRTQHLDLLVEEMAARFDLRLLRIPVAGRAAFEHVGDVDVAPVQADGLEELREQFPRCADERPAFAVLGFARRLPHRHDARGHRAITRHGLRSGDVQRTHDARPNTRVQLQQLLRRRGHREEF